MVSPTIKAKLVLDTGALASGTAGIGGDKARTDTFSKGLRSALEGLDLPVLGDIGAALAGMVLVFEAVGNTLKKMFNFLVDSSPLLLNSLTLLRKSFQILLRPIGDAIGLFIKPFAIAMLKFAIPLYKKWREFLDQPETQTGLQQISAGAAKVGEGLITLDFAKVKEGLIDVFNGIKNLGGGFFNFLGGSLDDFSPRLKQFGKDAWDAFKVAFSPIGEWLSGIILSVLPAPLKLVFKNVLENFGIELKVFDWDKPLTPFFDTMMTKWDDSVGPMVDSFKLAFEDKFPDLAKAIETIFGGQDDDTKNAGFFKRWIENASELDNKLVNFLIPSLGSIYTTVETIFGKNKNDKGDTVIGSFNSTTDSINQSIDVVDLLKESLSRIPPNITTTHTIITRYITERDD